MPKKSKKVLSLEWVERKKVVLSKKLQRIWKSVVDPSTAMGRQVGGDKGGVDIPASQQTINVTPLRDQTLLLVQVVVVEMIKNCARY